MGGDLILVNASPFAFENVDVWVNQRYMLQLDRLDVGETRTTWFGDYFDQWGETPVAGGFFRTEFRRPRLVEFEIDREGPVRAVAILDQTSYDHAARGACQRSTSVRGDSVGHLAGSPDLGAFDPVIHRPIWPASDRRAADIRRDTSGCDAATSVVSPGSTSRSYSSRPVFRP